MIWLVIGEDERRSWVIKAYKHELSAKTHAELAARHAEEYGYGWEHEAWCSNLEPNPWDRRMLDAESGVRYFIEQTDLTEGVSYDHSSEK